MTRPRSIRLFEPLFLGSFLLTLIGTMLAWPDIVAQAADQAGGGQIGAGALNVAAGFGVAVVAVITLLLWYFVARRGSTVAKWLVVLFAAWSLVSLVNGVRGGASLTTVFGGLSLAAVALQVVAAALLFAPDARAWFAGEPEPLP